MPLEVLALVAASPLWGALEPGPFRAGYRIVVVEDASRLDGPKRGPFADPAGPGPRRLAVHVWYPAPRDVAGEALTLGDYAAYNSLESRPSGPVPDAARRAAESSLRSLVQQRFGSLSDADWETLRSARATAVYEAPAAPGRFPLLIGMLRPVSTVLTAEYLASHGYIVAFVKSLVLFAESSWELDVPLRDMEVAASRMRAEPNVDPQRTGTIGFSGSGFSPVLLAMRSAHVDALVDLESALFAKGFYERLAGSAAYRTDALRIPFLHIYGRELGADPRFPEDLQDFREMRYSERLRLVLEAKGLDHWDVATEGMATATVLSVRGDKAPGVRRTFEAANLYTRRFLDAHVKEDAEARRWLEATPSSHGLEGVVTVEALPAAPAPASAADVERLHATRGPKAAVDALEQTRLADTKAAVLAEPSLNRIGYRLLGASETALAVDVFTMAMELYPTSPNAQDSLAEALEAAGRPAEAIAASKKALALVEASADPSSGGTSSVRQSSEERIKRLESRR
jgi:tetratricopeptide (TPR) repeat protein